MGSLLQSFAAAGMELSDAGVTQMSENTGYSLQRKASVTSTTPFSADQLERGKLIVLNSSSRREAVEGLKTLYPTLEEREINTIIADALNR
jgi:phage gp29-like protein